jgi:hypothetical protein
VNRCASPGVEAPAWARREKRACRAYVSDEQRRQAGCIGGQTGTLIHGRVLSESSWSFAPLREIDASATCGDYFNTVTVTSTLRTSPLIGSVADVCCAL